MYPYSLYKFRHSAWSPFQVLCSRTTRRRSQKWWYPCVCWSFQPISSSCCYTRVDHSRRICSCLYRYCLLTPWNTPWTRLQSIPCAYGIFLAIWLPSHSNNVEHLTFWPFGNVCSNSRCQSCLRWGNMSILPLVYGLEWVLVDIWISIGNAFHSSTKNTPFPLISYAIHKFPRF